MLFLFFPASQPSKWKMKTRIVNSESLLRVRDSFKTRRYTQALWYGRIVLYCSFSIPFMLYCRSHRDVPIPRQRHQNLSYNTISGWLKGLSICGVGWLGVILSLSISNERKTLNLKGRFPLH